MVLNNVSLSTGLTQDTFFLLNGQTTAEYPTLDLNRNLNAWYRRCVSWILQSVDGWEFNDGTATANLVASQQAYTFNQGSSSFNVTDVLKISRVEVTYDGTNWYKASPMQLNDFNLAKSQASNISGTFSTTSPYYDIHHNTIDLYPVPTANVTAGLKIYYDLDITDLAAAGDTPIIPAEFHRILSLGAAFDWASTRNQDMAAALKSQIDELHGELLMHYGDRAIDGQPTVGGFIKSYK